MNFIEISKKIIESVTPSRLYQDKLSIQNDKLIMGGRELDLSAYSTIHIVGIGKAAYYQTTELIKFFQNSGIGNRLAPGLVCTKYGHGARESSEDSTKDSGLISIHESGHPVCDSNSQKSAQALIEYLKRINANDLLVVCLSGGASAIISAPIAEFDLDYKKRVTEELLRAGAPIEKMNQIRKELSLVKNGGLGVHANCQDILVLAISDVSSNDLGSIGSGPFFYEEVQRSELITLSKTYLSKDLSDRFIHYLESQSRQTRNQELKAVLSKKNIVHEIIADPIQLVQNASDIFQMSGLNDVQIEDNPLEGDIKAGVEFHLDQISRLLKSNEERSVFISGGEYTVKVKGDGVGGRNMEFVLFLTHSIFEENRLELDESELTRIFFLSIGSDGTDGPTPYAGSFMNYELYQRSKELGLTPSDYLKRNDSLNYFLPLEAAIETGPTGTNVCDLRLMIITHKSI